MEKDILIVGGGIAGSVLAIKLINKGYAVDLVDNHFKENASKIAAGMINPVNFKRMITCWNAKDFLSNCIPFYKDLEEKWNVSFLNDVRLAKLMNSEHENELWQEACAKEATKEYLNPEYISESYKDLFQFDFAVGEVNNLYQLDTDVFLNTAQQVLMDSESLIKENFDHPDLKLSEEGVVWKSKSYSKVIFSEGMGITRNPFFNYLPFKATKGELIKVKADFDIKHTIKKNIFFHPEGNNEYWVGATYDWSDLTWETSEKGKEDLLSKLNKVVKFDFEVTDHKAGVRPTVKDRRPYLGQHPEHSQLYVFNGLGTRGVMMAPLLADHFTSFLKDKTPLIQELDIQRVKV